jgi:hypothetical protein
MAAPKPDREPPPAGRRVVVSAGRVDPEHPKRPVPPVTVAIDGLPEAVTRLRGIRSSEAPVVSLYWPVPEDLGQVKGGRSALHALVGPVREREQESSLPHPQRVSLRADVERIVELEALVPQLQGRTMAFFRCAQLGLEVAVVLPAGIPARVELDATPFLRPLLMVADEARRYAVAVVDRERGRLFEFWLGALESREREDGRALRKPNFAQGDKEHNVRHRAGELAKRHYRATAEALATYVQERGIESVVIGGHQDTVPAFLDELERPVRAKVAGTFVVDTRGLTPAVVRDRARRVVDENERREEEQLVHEALGRVAGGGLGAAGLAWCLLAVEEQAVSQLLVDPRAVVPGRVCDRCGWLGVPAADGDEPAITCPVDGQRTRRTGDVLDEMAGRVLDADGHVEHVHADTPLRDHTVAALLRFPVASPKTTT